jgi:hypothetical protein
MLKETGSGTLHRVEKGTEILGMTLAEVAPEQVVLRAGDESEAIPLVVAKGAGSPAAAAQVGPFGGPASPAPAPGTGQPGQPGQPEQPGQPGQVAPSPMVLTPTLPAGAQAPGTAPAAAPGPATTPASELILRRRAARAQQQPQPQN